MLGRWLFSCCLKGVETASEWCDQRGGRRVSVLFFHSIGQQHRRAFVRFDNTAPCPRTKWAMDPYSVGPPYYTAVFHTHIILTLWNHSIPCHDVPTTLPRPSTAAIRGIVASLPTTNITPDITKWGWLPLTRAPGAALGRWQPPAWLSVMCWPRARTRNCCFGRIRRKCQRKTQRSVVIDLVLLYCQYGSRHMTWRDGICLVPHSISLSLSLSVCVCVSVGAAPCPNENTQI